MPRVLRIINRFNLGGPTFNAAYLSKYLPDHYETMLVGGKKDYTEDNSLHIIDRLDLDPIVIPQMMREVNLLKDLQALRRIEEMIEDFQPDIVHTHASKAGALGRFAASRAGVKGIVHTFHGHVFHSYFGALKTGIYKSVERHLAAKSSRIVAISAKQKHELTEVYRIAPAEKVEVIELGFDLDRFQQDFERKRAEFRQFYQVDDDTVAIGIVGRLVPIKDHSMFIRSIDHLKKKSRQKFRAFIIGDGMDRPALEQLADSLDLRYNSPEIDPEDHLTFTSWLRDIDVANAGLDIAALTSKNEGTPVSLIEAQAANRPIVATDVGGIEDIVMPDRTALLSPAGDQSAFDANLLRLSESSELRAELGKNGWEFVKDRFHYSRLVADMVRLYEDII